MVGVHPLTKNQKRGIIPAEAIVFENPSGVHSFYMPGTQDLFISDFEIPDDFHIPYNLPE